MLFFVFLLLFSTFSFISAHPNQNRLIRSEQILNLTGDIDRRFSIKELRTSSSLNEVSLTVNTIGCIAALGVEDFRGMIEESQSCTLPRWDDVKIVLVPGIRTGGLQRRFAIWGLYLGFCLMVDEGFKSMIYSLFWENSLVGTIFITQGGSPPPKQFDTALNGTLIDQIQNAPKINARSDDALNDIDVAVSFVPRGQPFNLVDAAAVLAKLMVGAAEADHELRVRDSLTTKRGFSEWVSVESVLPLRGPPLMFTNRRVIEAALKITTWMVDNPRNRELIATVKLNGNAIGKFHGSSGAVKSVETS